MTASEVMRSASLRSMGDPVQVAHVGAHFGHPNILPCYLVEAILRGKS